MNLEIYHTAITLKNILISLTQGVTSAFSDFFYGIMQGTANFRDFMLQVLQTIERRLAEIAAQWVWEQGILPLLGGAVAGGGTVATAVAPAISTWVPPVPAQYGGIVTAPTLVLAGERGPEAIVPLDRASNFGSTVNVHIHAIDAASSIDFIQKNRKAVADALQTALAENSPVGRRRR